jgi:hypothetical protein
VTFSKFGKAVGYMLVGRELSQNLSSRHKIIVAYLSFEAVKNPHVGVFGGVKVLLVKRRVGILGGCDFSLIQVNM